MLHQPIPEVDSDDVKRVVLRDFGETQLSFALSILEEYRKQSGPSARVELAILKLTDGNLDQLRTTIKTAIEDYRDVLTAAEYPSYIWSEKDEVKQKKSVEKDWKQYCEWLQKK